MNGQFKNTFQDQCLPSKKELGIPTFVYFDVTSKEFFEEYNVYSNVHILNFQGGIAHPGGVPILYFLEFL